MSTLTDRAAYLRGLADGMKLDKSKDENKLILEMLNLLDEMAQTISEMDEDVSELSDYVEEIDSDLGEVEDLLFEDGCDCDEDDCDCCDEDCDGDCDCCDCCDCEDGEITFECPNCGELVTLNADAIDAEECPVCEHCGEPLFTDVEEEGEE